MERVAVLLLLGSLAVLAAADPAEYQSKGKYGYAPHGKEYPPHGYPPEGPKYKYDHPPRGYEYKPDGYYKPEAPYGYDPSQYEKVYEHNPLEGDYGQPSPYDGGYWGGLNGRQLIRLQALYPEDFLNTTLFDPPANGGGRAAVPEACVEPATVTQTAPDNCQQDFGVLCAWRHPELDSYSKGSDYASAKYEPIFKTAPVTPLEIGKGWFEFTYQDDAVADGIKLVTFNGHQKGYKVGDITGFINFKAGADACQPIVGPNTKVTFNEAKVPVYLIIGKIQVPNDPAFVLPLGGFKYISNNRQGATIQSADKADKGTEYKTDKVEYKTTPEGNKYGVKGDTLYVWSEKDQSYCGLSLVARGDVKVTYDPSGPTKIDYEGIMEWPILWTDLVTTLPLLIDDKVDPVPARSAQRDASLGGLFLNIYSFLFGGLQIPPLATFDTADIITFYLEKVLDRLAHVCKSNPDIAWITPGAITLDVTPVPRP